MTQLPTPVVQQDFGQLTQALFSGLATAGAVIDSAAAGDAREAQQTQAEFQLDQARSSAVLSQERVALMQQRIDNEELQLKYENAVELERLGLAKLLAEGEPEERTAFLQKYRHLDPENRRWVLAQHGRSLSEIDRKTAQAEILQYFAQPDADPAGITAEGLMVTRLNARLDLPPEARLAYQANFIRPMASMIERQVVSAADTRQAATERDGKRDMAMGVEQWITGTLDWEDDGDVQTESIEEFRDAWEKTTSAKISDNEFYRLVGQVFVNTVPSFGNDFKAIRERLDALPPEVLKANPRIKVAIDGMEKAFVQREQNKADSELLRASGDYSTNASITNLYRMEDVLDGLDARQRNNSQLMGTLNSRHEAIKVKIRDDKRMADAGVSQEAIDGARDMARNFGDRFQGKRSVEHVYEIARKMGRNEAINLTSGEKFSVVAEGIAHSQSIQDAREWAEVFSSADARRALPEIQATLSEKFEGKGKIGATEQTGWLWTDPDGRRGSFGQFSQAKRNVMLSVARDVASGLVEAGGIDKMTKAAIKAEKAAITARTGSLDNVAIETRFFGKYITTEADPPFNGPVWQGLFALQSVAQIKGGKRNLYGTFEHNELTYVPALAVEGPVAFLEFNPNTGAHRVIAPDTTGALPVKRFDPDTGEELPTDATQFQALKHRFESEFPDTDRLALGEHVWHQGLPTKHIQDADDILFPGAPEQGYWAATQRSFNLQYIEDHGPIPDFNPLTHPQPPPEEDEEQLPSAFGAMRDVVQQEYNKWLVESNRYNFALSRHLARLGWSTSLRAPKQVEADATTE